MKKEWVVALVGVEIEVPNDFDSWEDEERIQEVHQFFDARLPVNHSTLSVQLIEPTQ